MTKFRFAYLLLALGVVAPASFGADKFYGTMMDNQGLVVKCGSPLQGIQTNNLGNYEKSQYWYSLSTFTLGAQDTVNIGSQGVGESTGKAIFMPIVITKQVDDCTPVYLGMTTDGAVNLSGMLLVSSQTAVSGNSVPYLQIRYEVAAVASDTLTEDPTNGLIETITLNIGRIAYIYTPLNANGQPGAPLCQGWDIIKNVAWQQGCVL